MPQPEQNQRDPIFIADSDLSLGAALCAAFAAEGYPVAIFTDGMLLLEMARLRKAAAIFLDADVPGGHSLDILREIATHNRESPVVLLSERGDIRMAVDAIKLGAIDFIEKPIDPMSIVTQFPNTIETWLRLQRDAEAAKVGYSDFPGFNLLTPRERLVLDAVLEGASSKEVARTFGISPRTVEAHRAHIMEKLEARNTADLARIVRRERGSR